MRQLAPGCFGGESFPRFRRKLAPHSLPNLNFLPEPGDFRPIFFGQTQEELCVGIGVGRRAGLRGHRGSRRPRGRAVSANNDRGLGLALCLSKRAVERQGGTSWVESREGQGTTFSFSLPAATAVEPPPAPAAAEPEPVSA